MSQQYMFSTDDGNNLIIDTNTGCALFNGKAFGRPCTHEGTFMRAIPLELFRTIDFSQIRRVNTISNGTGLAVEPAGWNTVFFRALA